MLARDLEFVADQLEVEQEDPEVVAGASGIEAAFAAGGGASVERLGGDGQHKLDVGLDLAGVQRRLEPAKLDCAPVPDVVQVHAVVAGAVEVLRVAVVIAVPDAVELVGGSGTVALDVVDQVVAHRSGVGLLPVLGDAECREDEWLLLVDDLGEVAEGAPVEAARVHVDVDAAVPVDLGSALADRPDDLLKGRDVAVRQGRGDDLGRPGWVTLPPTTDWMASATRLRVRRTVSISTPKCSSRRSIGSPCLLPVTPCPARGSGCSRSPT